MGSSPRPHGICPHPSDVPSTTHTLARSSTPVPGRFAVWQMLPEGLPGLAPHPGCLPGLARSLPAWLAVGFTHLPSVFAAEMALLRITPSNTHLIPAPSSTVLVLSPGTVPQRARFVLLSVSTQMGLGTPGCSVKMY